MIFYAEVECTFEFSGSNCKCRSVYYDENLQLLKSSFIVFRKVDNFVTKDYIIDTLTNSMLAIAAQLMLPNQEKEIMYLF